MAILKETSSFSNLATHLCALPRAVPFKVLIKIPLMFLSSTPSTVIQNSTLGERSNSSNDGSFRETVTSVCKKRA